MEKLRGLILCGGKSSRMGSDKGLIKKAEKTWAEVMVDVLATSGLDALISINKNQKTAYSQIFQPDRLVLDQTDVSGPLNGLLSAHMQFPDHDFLLLATDMVDMDQDTLQTLIQQYQLHQDYAYYVYEQEGFTQSFCSIFTANALEQIYTQFKAGTLQHYSVHQHFKTGKTLLLPIQNVAAFNNYNQL